MALVATAIGIYEQSSGTTITLSRPDVFNGATPKAAIITAVSGVSYSYNASIARLGYSYGAVVLRNSGRAMGCGFVALDNTDPSATREITSNDTPLIIPATGGGTGAREAEMSGALEADGITLTKTGSWRSATNDVTIEVILLGGDDFDAWMPGGLVTSSPSQGIPFLPNAANYFGTGSNDGDPIFKSYAGFCQGFIVDKGLGGSESMYRNYSAVNGNATGGQSYGRIDNNGFFTYLSGSNLYNVCTHDDFASDGSGNYEHNFTIANGDAATRYMCAVYMKFDDEDVGLRTINLPSSTGSFTENGYGFNPSVVKVLGNTGVIAYNTTANNTNNSGIYWDWNIEGSGYSKRLLNQQQDPTIAKTSCRLGALEGYKVGEGTTSFIGANAQRIDNGFSVDFTSVTGSTGYTIGIAMGTPVEGGLNIALGSDSSQGLYLGSQQVTTAYLGSVSLGGAGGWRTLYSDPDPASDTSVWRGTNATILSVTGGLEITQTAAGLGLATFDSTVVVPQKEYRITIVTGAGDGSILIGTQDSVGTTLAPSTTAPTNSTSQVSARALDTGLQVLLISQFLNVGDKILIKSVLIEEMR